jgi:hypothetical protein
VLIALPALMENLVRRACLADGEIDLEPSVDCAADPRAQRRLDLADVAIVGLRGGDSRAVVQSMLQQRPKLRVMLIELAAADAILYELRPEQTWLGPVSPTEIVRAVHDDAAHAGTWAMLTQGGGGGSGGGG